MSDWANFGGGGAADNNKLASGKGDDWASFGAFEGASPATTQQKAKSSTPPAVTPPVATTPTQQQKAVGAMVPPPPSSGTVADAAPEWSGSVPCAHNRSHSDAEAQQSGTVPSSSPLRPTLTELSSRLLRLLL
ncbi:hypothetical protein GBAR_LOCUS29015 [Geodia barretti]|uniref:Uncharacterized protein n=1 Tax=Geodia barretti TaxID=519541 RepID=A0AA35TTZ6_GEOBA|nr:hypothetical protein GBAR_LOCUS29015 [Geodia barretti]